VVSSRNLQGSEREKVENLHFRPAKSRDVISKYSELCILQGRLIAPEVFPAGVRVTFGIGGVNHNVMLESVRPEVDVLELRGSSRRRDQRKAPAGPGPGSGKVSPSLVSNRTKWMS
jgi:hypothetical protein